MVSLEPRAAMRGSMKMRPIAVTSTPKRTAAVKPEERTVSAASFCWRPSSREMRLPEPMPRVKPTA